MAALRVSRKRAALGFRCFDNLPSSLGENSTRGRHARRLHRSEWSRPDVCARRNWWRRPRGWGLSERFEKFANAFLIRFNPRPPGRLSQLRAGRRSLIWVLQFFLCSAGFACEQSKQHSHRYEQNEKEIFNVHVSKSLNR